MVVPERRQPRYPFFGVVVGGDGGTACGLEKPRGKSACGLPPNNTSPEQTRQNAMPKPVMRTTAPRPRQGARPARQESAHGYNPKRRRACLCGGASRRGRHQRKPSRDEVATMRARNTMRFSAPTREPPGGRPSRGAKLKGRGCTRQKDAAVRTLRLGGTGAAKKAPSEQGATKAAGLGAEDARLEPRQWSAAERLSRDRRRKRRCRARAAT